MKQVWMSLKKSIQPQALVLWSMITVGIVVAVFSLTEARIGTYVRSGDGGEQMTEERAEPATTPIAGVGPLFEDDTDIQHALDVTNNEPLQIIGAKEQIVVPVSDEVSGSPIRLKIPKIGVNAAIVYVGVTSDGAMDTPKGPTDVAWFNLGPRPGEIGSAVISGHYGWKDNIPAVFDDLRTLKKGDKLYVEDEQGAMVTFVVREVLVYDEHQDATNVFVSSDGKAHLNLITCGGVWDKDQKSYSERTIVFTDKE